MLVFREGTCIAGSGQNKEVLTIWCDSGGRGHHIQIYR